MQAACIVSLALMVPCIICTACLAPETPRILYLQRRKAACVDSLEWLLGNLSEVQSELSRLSFDLGRSVGFGQIQKTISKRSILVPAFLSILIIILTSGQGFMIFKSSFVTKFGAQSFSKKLMFVENALKLVGQLTSLMIISKLGLKMLILSGKKLNLYLIRA